nr:putative ribonuclease H-like domain-containing protein [Tanacetum cinerariifolium]
MVIFSLSGKYTVLVVFQIVQCASGLSFLTAVCLIRQRFVSSGKENEVNILKSIDEGPFQMGTFLETLFEGNEGKYYLQSSTTPPSTSVQPYFANNTQLDSRLSLTDNLIENLTNTLALLTQSYKTYLPQINSQLRTLSNTRNQATVEDDMVVVHNIQGRQTRGQGNNARDAGAASYGGAQNRVGNAHSDKMLLMQAQENEVTLDKKQLLFIAGGQDNAVDEDVDEQPVQDLVLNVDNVFQADDCDAFDFDVDQDPTAQTKFMANLSSAYPVYDEAGPSYDSDTLSEAHDHDHYQDAVCEHYEVHEMHDDVQPNYVVDSHADYMSDSNMIPYDQYVKDNTVPVVQICVVGQLKDQVQSRGNTIRELREKISRLTKKHSDANPIHDLKALDSQNKELHAKVNALHDLNKHCCNLKAQIIENHKSNCVTMPAVKSKVLAPGMYVIDVEPIPPRNKNNREVHHYLKHLKESITTLREIIEDARVEQPFDNSLTYACCYTKHSQELVKYVIGTCPNDFNKGDKQIASTPVTRKKRVTFIDLCETSTHNNLTHVKQQTMNKTNEPVIPSTGVNDTTVVQIFLWYLDSGCSKHMTGDRSRLRKFVKNFTGIVKFGNDHFCAIMGYGDYVIGDSVISRVKFLRSKDETPTFVIKILKQIQVGLNKTIRYIRTDNGTEFVNHDLTKYYESVSIFHQKSVLRTPQQNGIVERQNCTLVEAARIMLIFSKALMFLWAEAVATSCYTQN